MKKIFLTLIMLCLVGVSLGLIGCGGGKQSAVQPTQPAPSPAAKQETVGDLFAKAKNLPGMSYDFAMTAADFKMTGTMWLSGKKLKSEMTMDNNKLISIVDSEAKVAYSYNPAQGTAMKMAYDEKAQTAPTPDRLTNDIDTTKVNVLETTTYDGVKCRVLLVKDNTSKAETKLWIREDYGVPLRVEAIDSDGGKMVMEYKNLKVGAQPASIFQLPAGVKVTDMVEMMKKVPKQ